MLDVAVKLPVELVEAEPVIDEDASVVLAYAEHVPEFEPPFEPEQIHDHGPVPVVKFDTVPAEQRFGLPEFKDENDCPDAEPHAPFMALPLRL